MSLTKAIQDLFNSFYELIASIFSAFYHVLQTVLNAIIGFFTGVVNLITDVFAGAVDVVGGVGKFVLSQFRSVAGGGGFSAPRIPLMRALADTNRDCATGNIVIISIIAGGGYAYTRYTAHGRQVAAGKKTA